MQVNSYIQNQLYNPPKFEFMDWNELDSGMEEERNHEEDLSLIKEFLVSMYGYFQKNQEAQPPNGGSPPLQAVNGLQTSQNLAEPPKISFTKVYETVQELTDSRQEQSLFNLINTFYESVFEVFVTTLKEAKLTKDPQKQSPGGNQGALLSSNLEGGQNQVSSLLGATSELYQQLMRTQQKMVHLFIFFERKVLILEHNQDLVTFLASILRRVVTRDQNIDFLGKLSSELINALNQTPEWLQTNKENIQTIIKLFKDINLFTLAPKTPNQANQGIVEEPEPLQGNNTLKSQTSSLRDLIINSTIEKYSSTTNPNEGLQRSEQQSGAIGAGAPPLKIDNLNNYLLKFERIIAREQEKLQALIQDQYTEETVSYLLLEIFVKDNISAILGPNFEALLAEKKIETLRKFFAYFKECNCQSSLKDFIVFYIRKKGTDYLKEPKTCIENLLKFFLDFEDIIEAIFKEEKELKNTIFNSFSDVLNKDPNELGEIYSKYLNTSLASKELRALPEVDLTGELEKRFKLFRFISAKDVFKEFYNQGMLKRLLSDGASFNMHLDRVMIELFRGYSGDEYVKETESILSSYEKSLRYLDLYKQEQKKGDVVAKEDGAEVKQNKKENGKEGDDGFMKVEDPEEDAGDGNGAKEKDDEHDVHQIAEEEGVEPELEVLIFPMSTWPFSTDNLLENPPAPVCEKIVNIINRFVSFFFHCLIF